MLVMFVTLLSMVAVGIFLGLVLSLAVDGLGRLLGGRNV